MVLIGLPEFCVVVGAGVLACPKSGSKKRTAPAGVSPAYDRRDAGRYNGRPRLGGIVAWVEVMDARSLKIEN